MHFMPYLPKCLSYVIPSLKMSFTTIRLVESVSSTIQYRICPLLYGSSQEKAISIHSRLNHQNNSYHKQSSDQTQGITPPLLNTSIASIRPFHRLYLNLEVNHTDHQGHPSASPTVNCNLEDISVKMYRKSFAINCKMFFKYWKLGSNTTTKIILHVKTQCCILKTKLFQYKTINDETTLRFTSKSKSQKQIQIL